VKKQIAVVGAAIVRDGTVLCAQRGGSGPLAGRWEFPGGKVEPGESPRAALEREIREELRCSIAVGEEVTTTRHEYDFAAITLTVFWADLIGGEPTLTEHLQAPWLDPAHMRTLEWADADIPSVEIIVAKFAAR
jgi:8-oxo-dGTP diphosphatase